MADDEEPPREAPAGPEPMGVAEWMVTYGDMMTLLLCFFVLLFIFSKSDVEKYKAAVGSIQDAFGVHDRRPESPFPVRTPSPKEVDQETVTRAENDLYSTLLEVVEEVVKKDPELKQSLRVETEETGVKVTVRNNKLFLPGTAYMDKGAATLLSPVVQAANRHNFNILVRNNSPKGDLDQKFFPSVWELSGARAGAALNMLAGSGHILPTRLKSMGMGDRAPLFSENDQANAAANSRTEFLFYFPGKEIWQ